MSIGRHNSNPFLSFIYWSSIYIFGIYIAVYYDEFKKLKSIDYQCILCATIALLSIIVSWENKCWFFLYDTYQVEFFRHIDVILIGKIFLILVLLKFFIYLNYSSFVLIKKILSILAKYSFSIFFLQQFAILHFERHSHSNFFSLLNFWGMHCTAFILTILVCVCSILIALIIKKITGKYSRMIIGS